MKATEIRIGNLLRVNRDGLSIRKGSIVEVHGIDADARHKNGLKGCASCRPLDPDQNTQGIWLEHLDPIRINDEFLNRNGFIKDDDTDSPYGRRISVNLDLDGWLLPDEKDAPCTGYGNTIKYIHQLQNALHDAGVEKEIII